MISVKDVVHKLSKDI